MSPAPSELLYLAAGLGTGGTERHLSLLLPALPGNLFRPRVWNAGDDGEAGAVLRAAGIPVERFDSPVSVRDWRRLAATVKNLRRRRPALVHSYLYGRHWLDAVACRLSGAVYIGSRRNLAHWRQGEVLSRERWRDRQSTAIVANSAAVAAVAVKEGAARDKIVIIPNGVAIPPWNGTGRPQRQRLRDEVRQELGIPPASRVVGSVAGLKPVKDPLTLLRAFAACAQPDRRLVMVGDGPLAAALRLQAGELGVEGAVIWAGAEREPTRLLPAFDLFALASRAEGFSVAVVEAMAAGLPVVATDVGGNQEAVENGANGLLVPPGDPGALAAAMDKLLTDADTAAIMGEAGRRKAARRYSLEAMVTAHVDLYARLVMAPGLGARRAG